MALINLKTNLAEKIQYNKKDLSTDRVNNAESNYDKLLPDSGQLITKDVGERYKTTTLDKGLFRGGIGLQVERTAEDVERIGKFLDRGKGLIHQVKQFYLQSQNADDRTKIYNPLSVISSLPNNISEQRHLDLGEGGVGGFFKGLIGINQDSGYEDSEKVKKDIKKRGGNKEAARFFDVKTKGSRKLQVRYGGILGKEKFAVTKNQRLPKDFIKFRIRDAVNGKWLIFPALLSGITDSSSTSPSEIQYIGRPDKVYVYGGTDRSIGFNLKVVALQEKDITIIWEKMNYLKGLVQPQFKEFKSDTGQSVGLGTRPVAPIVYLTIGDMFVNTPGFFKSVSIVVPENSSWELKDGKQFPHICDVSLDFQYIGKETPTMLGKNYEGNVGRKVSRDSKRRVAENDARNLLETLRGN